jgi:hypothetical protein
MRSLADKAKQLSLKYDLSDEVKLIQLEEQKLQQFLNDYSKSE